MIRHSRGIKRGQAGRKRRPRRKLVNRLEVIAAAVLGPTVQAVIEAIIRFFSGG